MPIGKRLHKSTKILREKTTFAKKLPELAANLIKDRRFKRQRKVKEFMRNSKRIHEEYEAN